MTNMLIVLVNIPAEMLILLVNIMALELAMSDENSATVEEVQRSAVEEIKEESRALRGTLALELAGDAGHFNESDKNLLKFHGSYQQENRDARKARRSDGLGKAYMFMIRCKIPGGRVAADQYLALDALCESHGNATLRVTTRQSFQFHGVLWNNLKDTIAGINATLLSTLGACGDVNRNVMACPAPIADGMHDEIQRQADAIAAHLAPRTRAYHEVWLNGKEQPVTDAGDDEEPIYGKVYLPRKFKTGLTLPHDNCIDIYAQDLGFLAVVENGKIVGYDVLVGGGMGMTHGKHETFPHLGRHICFVEPDEVVKAAEAVITLFRDHGNRADRKRARIKYLVHDWGVEKFREMLTPYLSGTLTLPRDLPPTGVDLHLGWHPQGDGKWFYGVSIENGRIKDEGDFRMRTALRTLVAKLRPEVRLTAQQDVLLCGLPSSALPEIEATLRAHGIKLPEDVSPLRRNSMACPAIPTCGLALSESERALPTLLDELEVVLAELGLEHEEIGVRMTGCPNGCARPYQSDIGLVGRAGVKYTVYVGGRSLGDRLNFQLKDLVPRDQIVTTLRPLLAKFKAERRERESFGDFCARLGQAAAREVIAG
jgi:sulfite reductase (ferredoxin)